MLSEFPRIRAWFSGHFHLSHTYADSIVATGGCAFVQTGVIGPHCNRDGERHSRLLRVSDDRCKVPLPTLALLEAASLCWSVQFAPQYTGPTVLNIPGWLRFTSHAAVLCEMQPYRHIPIGSSVWLSLSQIGHSCSWPSKLGRCSLHRHASGTSSG